jgi:hypothetical protein
MRCSTEEEISSKSPITHKAGPASIEESNETKQVNIFRTSSALESGLELSLSIFRNKRLYGIV